MGRKIIDTYPVVTLTPVFYGTTTPEQAQRACDDLLGLIKTHIVPHRSDIGSWCRDLDIEATMETEATCEHCNYSWTEDSPLYNGGCCGKDEANNPERMIAFGALAERVSGGDFYPLDEGKRGRTRIDWPNTLGDVVLDWISKGRPGDGPTVQALLSLADRVRGRDWCTVWEDPGPDGCSLARLPDEVRPDGSPNELADDLRSLLDDLGLIKVAA